MLKVKKKYIQFFFLISLWSFYVTTVIDWAYNARYNRLELSNAA